MNRNETKPSRHIGYLSVLFFLFAVGDLQTHAEQSQRRAATKPNLLLIVADDLGFSDLGCYGGEIETPNLDRLAANGLRLTQFYTTGRCCPSRASLLTGQYPHRVGLGHMTKDIGRPGYSGRVAAGVRTIAERLSGAGYRSFLSGKWHLGTTDPTQHGFEEFYGTLVSAKTFWDRNHFIRLPEGREAKTYENGGFYGTNALADHAIEFVELAGETPRRPWFLYLALNAPHFPLHAPKELIDKYVDRYANGWDVARMERLVRMKELGIIPQSTELPPRSPHYDWAAIEPQPNPAWDSLDKERQIDLIRRMAIYAAMVDSMDQNIGRILDELKRKKEINNTLIVFTSDNGACAEWDPFGFDGKSGPSNKLHRGDELKEMGTPGTFHSAGSGWANVSNTPWRLYKHYNHEGGIAVPAIFHWPVAVSDPGRIDGTPAHLIDILPTLLDVTDAASSSEDDFEPVGESLLPLIQGEPLTERMLFFEHEGNRAVRAGRWKLVALRDQPWELFDMQLDRTELQNLVTARPKIVQRLEMAWTEWAEENQVTPLPDDYQVEYVPARVISQASATQVPAGPVRKIAGGFRFTEGPAWDGKNGWYFSDIPNKTMHRLSVGGDVKLVRTGEQASNGIVIAPSGRLFFCEVGGRRIVARSLQGDEVAVANGCEGRPLGMPNDLWLSPSGGIYFTIPKTNKRRSNVVPPDAVNGTVCLLDLDSQSVRDVGVGLTSPNGIVGSGDGKFLYVADPGAKKCWRYTIAGDGSLRDQQLAANQGSDGLEVDDQGNLYTTSQEGIAVYSPDAKWITTIKVPERPANMKFGEARGRTLFITARTGIYTVEMNVRAR